MDGNEFSTVVLSNETINEIIADENNKYLAVATDKCAYILYTADFSVVSKMCQGTFTDVSYCCGKFSFIDTRGYIYVYDIISNTWQKLFIGDNGSNKSIVALENGFMVMGKKLAYITWYSHMWMSDIILPWSDHVTYKPAIHKWLLYVPLKNIHIYNVHTGVMLKSFAPHIEYNKYASVNYTVYLAACSNRLYSVAADSTVNSFDIANPIQPRLLWHRNICGDSDVIWNLNYECDDCCMRCPRTAKISINNDCSKIATILNLKRLDRTKLKAAFKAIAIIGNEGNILYRKILEPGEDGPTAVLWLERSLLISTEGGKILLFEPNF